MKCSYCNKPITDTMQMDLDDKHYHTHCLKAVIADTAPEYEITMRLRANSSLDPEKLKQLLVVALLDDLTMIPDGATDELQVIEYDEITVEVI